MQGLVRLAWVVLAILLSVGLLLGLLSIAGQAGSAITWRSEVDRYLAREAASGHATWHVRQVARAGRPDLFSLALAGEPRSDSLYPGMYREPLATSEPAYPPSNPLATAGPRSGSVSRYEELLYPPVEVWCVLLDGWASAAGPQQAAVIFVARHESLYSGSWVVYSGARSPFAPEFLAGLRQLGCELEFEPRT